jgi:hypothetical protein
MQTLMIILSQEFLQDPVSMLGGSEANHIITFLLDGPKEAFHLSIGLRTVRLKQTMLDALSKAGFLKMIQAISMKRITHGKGKGGVGQDGFQGIKVIGEGLKEKVRSAVSILARIDGAKALAREIINNRKPVLLGRPPSGRNQVFDIQVQQFTGIVFFIAADLLETLGAKVVELVRFEHPVNRGGATLQTQCDTGRADTLALA